MWAGTKSLPSGVRLLHIGPHKSGTTAIQGAFHVSREALAEHGVTYVGRSRQPAAAAWWVTGRPGMFGAREAGEGDWRALVDEAHGVGDGRAVVSSEFFCEAEDDAIPRIVSDLGGERVHVVVTLRPLAKVLAAQWQQYVQNGLRVGFADWLNRVFGESSKKLPNRTFWRRHDQGTLVRRWAEAVGADNVTVIAVDDSDRRMLLRSFEELLALPEGLLPEDDSQANRSLSYGEAEMVRAFNKHFRERGWHSGLYRTHVRHGAVNEMKAGYRPSREAGIRTPLWALERAAKIGDESAQTIQSLGVRVIGDLTLLAEAPKGRAGKNPKPAVPPEAAALAMLGAISADTASPTTAPPAQRRDKMHPRALHEASGRELLRELRARLRRRVSRAR